ncbi:MAG: N-formylglutamate amidohydrolase [Hyphomicrobiales bacterium]|nr:N-formylglutamate amidohydrolase [Hyphomicrobiales bacterium]
MPGAEFDNDSNPAFRLHRPAEQRVPFVFNSPHSGRVYPSGFLAASKLSAIDIRRSEDVFVDELFAGVVELGAPLLAAQFPRAWLDVNREPYELDPKLFAETLPAHANSRSMRVAGGLGTVPRLVAENVEIYRKRPSLADAMGRIENVYRPYHATLRGLMARTSVTFGHAILVDCHSMPSNGARNEGQNRPDIIIGDRYGTSCNGDISRGLMRHFSELGYSVTRNKPYAGGFITEHYGRPLKGLHAVQIEINRGLYVNEKTLEPTVGFAALAEDIKTVIAHVISLPDSGFYGESIAAE